MLPHVEVHIHTHTHTHTHTPAITNARLLFTKIWNGSNGSSIVGYLKWKLISGHVLHEHIQVIVPRGMRAPRKRARSIDHPARGDETGSPVRRSFERLSFTPRITARRVKRRAIACSAYTSLEVLKNKEKKKKKKKGEKDGGRRKESEETYGDKRDAARFLYTQNRYDAVPESFNFTKGVQRHVYLLLPERVKPRTIRVAFRAAK